MQFAAGFGPLGKHKRRQICKTCLHAKVTLKTLLSHQHIISMFANKLIMHMIEAGSDCCINITVFKSCIMSYLSITPFCLLGVCLCAATVNILLYTGGSFTLAAMQVCCMCAAHLELMLTSQPISSLLCIYLFKTVWVLKSAESSNSCLFFHAVKNNQLGFAFLMFCFILKKKCIDIIELTRIPVQFYLS